MDYASVINDIDNLGAFSKSRPYLFRTRFERILNRVIQYSQNEKHDYLLQQTIDMKQKFICLSDQSNQSVDGSLKSFEFMKEDIKELKRLIQENY